MLALLNAGRTVSRIARSSADPHFMFRDHDKTSLPGICVFESEDLLGPSHQSATTRLAQSDEGDSIVSSRRKLSRVREIKILRYKKTSLTLCCGPDAIVVRSGKSLIRDV